MVVTLLAQAATTAAPPPPTPAMSTSEAPAVTHMYVPERVFDTRRKTFSDFEMMLADLARADVVVVGEQHDDPNTHRLESALLQGLLRRRVPVTVSLEMFERDVQTTLDSYRGGSMSEEDFLKASRPWPRYRTDYRSLVEIAKAHGWPIVAANVPRRLASEVAKAGKPALDRAQAAESALLAVDVRCPNDDYFERFAAQMGGHGAPDAPDAERRATMERYYLSQCVKDETMAESIAAAFERQTGAGTIVHFNGAFHSDFGAGTAERVRRRLTGRRVAVVSILPVADLDTLMPDGDDVRRAEYVIYTVK